MSTSNFGESLIEQAFTATIKAELRALEAKMKEKFPTIEPNFIWAEITYESTQAYRNLKGMPNGTASDHSSGPER